MPRTSISLDAEQMEALKRLATSDRASVAEVVRRAVAAYLAERCRGRRAWGERFDALAARVQERMPADITPEEIEADITAARAEVRRARRTGGAATAGARRR
jgi:Arc/MetJ-type ribon-helix-helix transcriptional regulator